MKPFEEKKRCSSGRKKMTSKKSPKAEGFERDEGKKG